MIIFYILTFLGQLLGVDATPLTTVDMLYVCMFVCLEEWRRVDIRYQYAGWLIMCDASDIVEYDRRTPELSIAPLHMKQDTTSTPV